MTASKGSRDPKRAAASLLAGEAVVWPSSRWRADIAGFARDVLCVSPTAKQCEIFDAVLAGRRVAIRGGRKSGKTATIAMVALWYFASFPGARVKLVAPTADALDEALFRQIREYWNASQSTSFPLDGERHTKAWSGIRAHERFADISGVAARDEGSVRGVSGAHVLYILDEASDIPDDIFHAADGNLAAGGECRMIVCSNPTRADGYFFDCFSILPFTRIHAPSDAGLGVTGFADRQWIESRATAWGLDSYHYRVHVLGEFAAEEQGRIFPVSLVADAFRRFDPTNTLGDLAIGLDVAGEGGNGDESIFAVRRGSQIVALYPYRGLSAARHVTTLRWVLETHRRGNELVRVNVDGNGGPGDQVWRALRDAEQELFLRVRRFRYSDGARQPKIFGTMRDEIHTGAADWLRHGGALLYDQKLEGELALPATYQDQRGRTKVTDKTVMSKKLGRSPDRLDAVCLAVWDAESAASAAAPQRRYSSFGFGGDGSELRHDGGPGSIDPYRAEDAWRRRR